MCSAGEGRAGVQMVEDEVFCWLPRMTANRGVPLLRVLTPNTRCLNQNLEQRGVLCSENEYSDDVWSNTTRLYYKDFAGAKSASAPIRKEVEENYGKREHCSGACQRRRKTEPIPPV